MAAFPAPQLPGEALLEVFVHHLAQPRGVLTEPYGNSDRLRLNGKTMLAAAYYDAIFQCYPNQRADEYRVSSPTVYGLRTYTYAYGLLGDGTAIRYG